MLVAIERTGIYHLPVKRAFSSQSFDTRIVHPLTTKQYRLPADPGNKTDDTDLFAIHRATTNGFGLIELPLDEIHGPLRLLARYRRSLVRKNASFAIRSLRFLMFFCRDIPDLQRRLQQPGGTLHRPQCAVGLEGSRLGSEGLAQILKELKVRYQRRTLKKILDWANGIDSTTEYSEMYYTILVHLDDERCGRLQQIAKLEQEMASFLVRTAYVVLLSIPGVSIVTAAEFAGEMGPITNYANDQAITGRAGI